MLDKDLKGAVGEAGAEREGNKPSLFNFFDSGRALDSVDMVVAVGGERCEDLHLLGM